MSLETDVAVVGAGIAGLTAANRAAQRARACWCSRPARTSGRMFGQSRGSPKRVAPLPIAQPPFYAIPVVAGISYTMGGIEIDAQARVIARGGAPFPGLLGAGACTGGIKGGPLGGYVGGFLKAATLGLIAAETIGAEVGAGP